MKAYLNDPKVKEKYVVRVKAHAEADEIKKGFYWEDGKGCAVGCTIEGSDHSKYEKELGIPEVLAHLEDCLFEALPNGKAKAFPLKFLEAINVGADLSLVAAELMVWQFEDKKYGIKHLKPVKEDKGLLRVCEDVTSAYKRVLGGEKIENSEWKELYQRADKIYDARAGAWARAWARAWAWATAWAWARAGAGAGAGAWTGARAGAGAWARAGAWTGARADYDRLYEEAITATSEKLLEILKATK